MPTNDSNLTNTYIANTYQKLLQVDSQHNGLGYITFGYNELVNALNGDSATLLNGLGQRQAALVIDHNTTGNGGGIFVKNDSQYTGGMWGMQVVNSGLNFWTVGVGGDNYRLFLKNTGTVWIGYSDYSVPGTDESGYNLYVREGITSEVRIRSGIYNGHSNLPNPGRGSNSYYLHNQVLQLGNEDEIISSGTSDFDGSTGGGNITLSYLKSNYCQESQLSSFTITNEPKMRYGSYGCRIHWVRIGQIVHCSFILNSPVGSSNNAASGLEGNLIPLPVMTSRGDLAKANITPFGTGTAYVPIWDNPSGNLHFRISPNSSGVGYSNDEITVPVEVKGFENQGGNGDYSKVVIAQHWYTGSSGSTSGVRGTFTYQLE
jgi:hypothetical protein